MFRDMDNYILGLSDNLDLLKLNNSIISVIEQKDIGINIKKRNRATHKGSYGKVGFLSGSKGMAGAAVLNCNAALRSGAGLVKACIPESIYPIIESMSIETITYPFYEEDLNHEDLRKELILFSDVIATGSGCTRLKNYNEILKFLISNTDKPLIIDAEGINLLDLNDIRGHAQKIILTPHYGEMARLLKCNVHTISENIIGKIMDFAIQNDVYLVLKGARTLITTPSGKAYINITGNPGMATAGSGDVLTGVIAALIAQNINVKDALKTAVYLHGLAGDIGSSIVGEYSLIASDLIKYLPAAFTTVIENS